MKTQTIHSFFGITGVVINGLERSQFLLYKVLNNNVTNATHFHFSASSVFLEVLLPEFYSWLINDLHMDLNILYMSMALC
jgi:hypothetical protein